MHLTQRTIAERRSWKAFLSAVRLQFPMQEVSMMNRIHSVRGFALGVCLASVLAVLGSASSASAQQGKYVTQASARLSKLVDAGNTDGYSLPNNSFSLGGGWLKKLIRHNDKWVSYLQRQPHGRQEISLPGHRRRRRQGHRSARHGFERTTRSPRTTARPWTRSSTSRQRRLASTACRFGCMIPGEILNLAFASPP